MAKLLVVSIGTTHPWNIAGVGLDLIVGREFDARVLTVVVAVSAQDAEGIRALHPVPADVVRAQLQTILWDDVDAVKVGAFASAQAADEVANAARANARIPFVVDPVFSATLGGEFGGDPVVAAVRDRLGRLKNVILTPNLDEAASLLGRANVQRDDLADAATSLQQRGVQAVLLKGGHLDGEPADVLASGSGVDAFVGERLGAQMRGTGCVLAMALACELARGLPLVEAVQSARSFVRSRIARRLRFAEFNVPY
jgi:hydroxymethylpyrimidine/phosphomethylpyrimidine kinase